MTDDPKRLIHESQHALERELLTSLREISPPEGALELGWQDLLRNATLLGVAASVGQNAMPSATLTSAKVATKLASAKLVLAIAAGGVGVGGSLWAIHNATRGVDAMRDTTSEQPLATSQTETQVFEPVIAPQGPPGMASVAVPAPPPKNIAPSRSPSTKAASQGDLLLRESKALAEVRAQLRRGDTAGANATLQKLDSEFPRGRLTQEREVLHIELLSATGRTRHAAARAIKFLKRYPDSPHAAHVQRFATSQ